MAKIRRKAIRRYPKVAAESFNTHPVDAVPRESQRIAQMLTGYGAIILESSGDHDLYVKVEHDGDWITVIHETVGAVDGSISHCVEPLGIQDAIRRARGEFAL